MQTAPFKPGDKVFYRGGFGRDRHPKKATVVWCGWDDDRQCMLVDVELDGSGEGYWGYVDQVTKIR